MGRVPVAPKPSRSISRVHRPPAAQRVCARHPQSKCPRSRSLPRSPSARAAPTTSAMGHPRGRPVRPPTPRRRPRVDSLPRSAASRKRALPPARLPRAPCSRPCRRCGRTTYARRPPLPRARSRTGRARRHQRRLSSAARSPRPRGCALRVRRADPPGPAGVGRRRSCPRRWTRSSRPPCWTRSSLPAARDAGAALGGRRTSAHSLWRDRSTRPR